MAVEKTPEKQTTLRELVKPRNALKLTAGLIGLVFDRLQGVSPERGDDLTVISGQKPEREHGAQWDVFTERHQMPLVVAVH